MNYKMGNNCFYLARDLGVRPPFDEYNIRFLKHYVGIDLPKLSQPYTFNPVLQSFDSPDKRVIRSGDTFQILRLDGIDPIITWGMGSVNGNKPFIAPYISSSFN